MYIIKAMDYYHSLSLSGQWNIPKGHGKFNACFNCGDDDCWVSKYKKPKDEKKIAATHKKFQDEQKKHNEAGGNSSRHGGNAATTTEGVMMVEETTHIISVEPLRMVSAIFIIGMVCHMCFATRITASPSVSGTVPIPLNTTALP